MKHRLAGLAPLVVGLFAAIAGEPERAAGQTGGLSSYALVDTWSEEPWSLRPGFYRDAVDLGSDPQGRLFLLDARLASRMRYGAIHALDAEAHATEVWRLPNPSANLTPSRLDIGPDGHLWVLWTGLGRSNDQVRVDRIELGAPDAAPRLVSSRGYAEDYRDLALDRQGRLFLARYSESFEFGAPAVDVYDDARFDHSIDVAELVLPYRVDVADDGTVYVLHELPPPPNEGGGGGGGGPRPGPGPSSRGPGAAPLGLAADPVPGVVVFDAAHAYVETVPFDFGIDVATGRDGTYVARYGQVFALREDGPITPLLGQTWTGQIGLEVPAGGGVYGSLSHCAFEGAIGFRQPLRRPAPHVIRGGMDHPALEGPAHPLRLAAGAGVAVLQGRFGPGPAEDEGPLNPLAAQGNEPQSVQSWTLGGDLAGQMGVCAPVFPSGWARDVALDGAMTYHTVGANCLEQRPGDGFASWTKCLDGLWGADAKTLIAAISADAGRVAILDSGAAGVVMLDASGAVTGRWSLLGGAGADGSPVVDLDLAGDRLLLARRGAAQLEVRDLDGNLVRSWAAHDSPESVAWGPNGEAFALGKGGWAQRYGTDGRLEALWAMPEDDVRALDLAVGDDGRVFVPFVRYANGGRQIQDQGVWVFEASAAPPAAPPAPPDACQATPDKTASPRRIPLGDSVEVTLQVSGTCPGRARDLQLMIVFDTSRSMNWGYALAEAKHASLQLLALLDPAHAEVGAVSFNDEAALVAPLGRDLAGVGRKLAALSALGDTRLTGALTVAREQFDTAPAPQDGARAIIIVTDANPTDPGEDLLAELAASGIGLHALVFEQGQDADPAFLDLFALFQGSVYTDPSPVELGSLAEGLAGFRPEPGLFRSVTVTDDVPANMRYVAGSAVPPADFDAAANRLTWRLGAVAAADGLRLRYRLIPQEVGVWPTNVRAGTDHVDAVGQPGQLVFPIPEVEVTAPQRRAIYLPLVIRERCLHPRRPADVVLVLDTSSSMAEPARGGQPEGPTKLDEAKAAARAFVGFLAMGSDRTAVVGFNAGATAAIELSGDREAVERALDGLTTQTGTKIDLGLAEAGRVLGRGRRAGALPVVILLSDGLQNGDAAPVRAEATSLKGGGAVIYTIGLGPTLDEALLREAATSPDRYHHSPTAGDLAAIYSSISERLSCE